MTMRGYYIDYNHQRLGPFDMVSMMRKIRNGQVIRETAVYLHMEDAPRAAGEYTEFREIFLELERSPAVNETRRMPSLSFMQMMKRGAENFLENLVTSVYSGIFLVLVCLGVVMVYRTIGGGILSACVGAVLGYFLFSLYLLVSLRKVRMQLLSANYLGTLIKRAGKPLLVISLLLGTAVFGIPVALAMLAGPLALTLILLPGSLVMMLFLYAPVLAADRGLGVGEALRQSVTLVQSTGPNNFVALYLVLLVNFIAAAFPVLLLFSLPVTLAALCEVYDDHFNEFSVE